jgi:hypothetical protein
MERGDRDIEACVFTRQGMVAEIDMAEGIGKPTIDQTIGVSQIADGNFGNLQIR